MSFLTIIKSFGDFKMKKNTKHVTQNELQTKSAKQYFATLLLVLALFFSFTESGVAQCPPGYTSVTVTGAISPTCSFTVTYCYICAPGGFNPYSAIIQSESLLQSSTECNLLYTDVRAKIDEAIIADYKYRCTYPPCGTASIPIFTVSRAMCTKTRNSAITINGNTSYSASSVICDFNSAYCVTEYSVCAIYETTPECADPVCIKSTFIRNYPVGTPNCSSTLPSIPPTGKTWFEEWETDCYTVGCY